MGLATSESAPAWNHSSSNAMRSSIPASAARWVMRLAKVRWQPGKISPSCVCLWTGAQAHPGCAATTPSAEGSGMSRRSPTGPPTSSLAVMESSTRKTSKTGDMPIPYRTARSRSEIGTVFTRVTPALSTWERATTRMPCAPSDSVSSLARSVRPAASSRDAVDHSSCILHPRSAFLEGPDIATMLRGVPGGAEEAIVMRMEEVDDLGLVDHHCHGLVTGDLDRAGFEALISESFHPAPEGTSHFDSPIGLAIRRWCGPVLGLDAFAPPEDYVARRLEMGAEEVARRFLREAGLGALFLDTGYRSEELHEPEAMQELSGTPTYRVVRLEAVAETVAGTGVEAGAYRGGFGFDPNPPDDREAVRAAGAFLEAAAAGPPRLTDPVLLRFGIWTGARLARERGLPIQFHVGWGDPDIQLHRTNPTLLTRLIREFAGLGVNVALLHCYPFHRDAGYLAAMYPNVYFDVGSALHFLGPSSARLLGEAMEVAPFGKLLYSSDAFGVAEAYFLGSILFRRALREVLDGWIAADHCDAATAGRIAEAIGRGNAGRIYPLHDAPG